MYFFQINSKNIINYMRAIITNNFGGKKCFFENPGLYIRVFLGVKKK
jgi:hypothetical protein